MTLPRNVGGLDRTLRVVAGAIFLPLGVWLLAQGCPCGWVDAVLGVIGLATGLSGRCLLYLPFGISTARTTVPFPR